MDLSGATSSEVVVFFAKFSNGKTLGGISVIALDRCCFKVSVAVNRMRLGGVFKSLSLAYPNS